MNHNEHLYTTMGHLAIKIAFFDRALGKFNNPSLVHIATKRKLEAMMQTYYILAELARS